MTLLIAVLLYLLSLQHLVTATCVSTGCQCAGVCCYRVEENRPPGVFLGTVQDIDDPEVQTLLNQTGAQQFTVTTGGNVVTVSNNGTLFTNASLDSENRVDSCYQVFLSVLVGSTSKQVILAIQVLDVNDNSPTFSAGPVVNISVFETNTILTDLSCSSDLLADDSDHGQNGTIANYTVLSPAMNFTVFLESDGRLCLRNLVPLDRETQDSIDITIIAYDNGTVVQRNSTLQVRLTLLDKNDNAPIFTNFNTSLYIPESTPVNQSVYTYTATDPDIGSNAEIYFKLTNSTPIPFSLLNGTLYVSQPLDADTICPDNVMYTFNIIISNSADGTGLKTMRATTVTLINENDSPPIVTTTAFITSIVEETQVPDQVLAQFAVTDTDCQSSIMYSVISGQQYASVQRLFTTNVYLLRSNPFIVDREEMDTISITILFQDNGNPPNNATITYTINVTDINDNNPNLTQTHFTVTEDTNPGVIIAQLSEYFTDPDQGPNGSPGHFEQLTQTSFMQTSSSGIITLESQLDRETIGDTFDLLITVYDDGNDPQLSSNITITISITDVNDNSPIFLNLTNGTVLHLIENSSPNTLVTTLQVRDIDKGNNAVVTFSVDNSTDFYIDSHNGSLFSSQTFDRETTDSIQVVVVATDSGTPPLSNLVRLIINITDINDNSPRFYNSSYNFNISADASIGTQVGVVSAWDPDIGINSIVQYEISTTTTSNYFGIHLNGTLYITSILPSNSANASLLLIAYNPNNKALNDTVWVDIVIVPGATPTSPIATPIVWYAVNIGAPIGGALVVSICIVVCLICTIRYYKHRYQSRDLYKASSRGSSNHTDISQDFSSAPKMKSSLRAVPVAGSRYEDSRGFYKPQRESTGDVIPKSPMVNFSEESEVMFYNTDQALTMSDTCTVRVQREEYEMKPTKKTPDSPDHFTPPTRGTPTMRETKISSPSLSDDLSTSPSLGTSTLPASNHDLSHFYTQHSSVSKTLPVLREELLKKHDREYAETTNTFPSAIIESAPSEDTPPLLSRTGGNVQGYLASSAPPLAPPHHNSGSGYSYQNGSLPSGDTNPASLHYPRSIAPPNTSTHIPQPHPFYSNGSHAHNRTRDMYYKAPPINGTSTHIRQTSSSSSSSSHHRTPQLPPPTLEYAPPPSDYAPPISHYHHSTNNYYGHSSSSSSNEYTHNSTTNYGVNPLQAPPNGHHMQPQQHNIHHLSHRTNSDNSSSTKMSAPPILPRGGLEKSYRSHLPPHLIIPPGGEGSDQPRPPTHGRTSNGGSYISTSSFPSTMGSDIYGHYLDIIDDTDDDASTVASSVLDQYLQFEPAQLKHQFLSLSVDDMKLSSITRNDSQ